MSKTCSKCKKSKHIQSFYKNSASKDKLQTWCKTCALSSRIQYYYRNKTKERQYDVDRKKEIRLKSIDYLKDHPCVDCGEDDPIVLEFDHIKDNKTGNISNMISTGCGWNRILQEIANCEVRCANCHRRKTAKQFNWYN